MKKEEYLEYAQDDTKFAEWLQEVNSEIEKVTGMGIFDLPDQLYRDMYDAGDLPIEVIADILEEEGY